MRIKDLLVIGVDVEALEESIDAHLGAKPALSIESSVKQSFGRHHKDSHLWTFFHWGKTVEVLEEVFRNAIENDQFSDVIEEQLQDEYIESLKGLTHLGISAKWGELTQIFSTFHYDQSRLPRVYGRLLSQLSFHGESNISVCS